jgi:hypothetical protein
MPLVLNYGNAVSGDQRFPRPELEARFMRALNNGAGVKLFGLRRIGKSTLRLYATEQFAKTGRTHIFIDGQGLQSLGDLLGRLIQGLPNDKSWIRRALALVSSAPARIALDALTAGTQYEEAALSAYWLLVSDAIRKALGDEEHKPVLVIDEFTYLIDNMIRRGPQGCDDAGKLLASMRKWRAGGLTMLLTGSLGLTALARKHALNLEHLNDLQPFTVPELTEAEARAFIGEATRPPPHGNWTEAHTDEFLAQSGVLYPCFLVSGLLQIGIDHPPPPDVFAAIFSNHVRPNLHDDFYRQFNRRFKDYTGLPNGEQTELILPALKSVMAANPACSQDSIACAEPFTRVDLALALDMLAEDGFIHFTENAQGVRLWKPASRLARLWWARSRLA